MEGSRNFPKLPEASRSFQRGSGAEGGTWLRFLGFRVALLQGFRVTLTQNLYHFATYPRIGHSDSLAGLGSLVVC
jgi:hypothetical protein